MIANKSNKAIVLIATIATLAVISVILMFFAQSSMFERQLTSNDNLERQAKLVATASIEWAASHIPTLAMGADGGDSSVKSKAYSSVADFYQFKVNGEVGYDPHCPVEEHYSTSGQGGYTGKPSFYYENKEEQELPYEYSYRQDFDINMVSLPTVHNKNSKVKNNTPETEEIEKKRRWTVHSTLKCVDANAFWNINSPINNTKANYKNMVESLVSVVLGTNGEIVQKWVEERGKGEFADLGDFRKRMSSVKSLKQKDLDKLCRYITVDSWGNEKSFKYGANYTNYDQELSAIFEKRYPININVASWEILATVFATIEANNNISIDRENEAIPLAKDIVQKRYSNPGKSFKTWNEVEKYLYDYDGLSKDKAETIFAVIYPGMLPHKKSPNKAQYRKFDKSDITVGTTECCLFSPGVFYCEAIGRVIEYNKKPYTVLAHSKVSVNMKLWESYIVNSQSDFEWQRHEGDRTLATWSGVEGGYYPEEYPAQKTESKAKNEVSAGFIQERGFWDSGNAKFPDACRYWSWAEKDSGKTEDNLNEKRVDGIYMKQSDKFFPGILEEAYNTKSETKKKWDDDEWKDNKWQDNGFDLWIKPSYNDGDEAETPLKESLLIAVKKEKAETTSPKCYILTRCSYDFDSSDESPYLTISRTLVTDEKTSDDSLRTPTDGSKDKYRIFYNSTIFSEDKQKELFHDGQITYQRFYAYLLEHWDEFFSEDEVPEQDYTIPQDEFASDFVNKVYRAIMQEDTKVKINYKVIAVNPWEGQQTIYNGQLIIFLPKNSNETHDNPEEEKTNWCYAQIDSGFGGHKDLFQLYNESELLYIYHYNNIFTTQDCVSKIEEENGKIDFGKIEKNRLYYSYVQRDNPQKEAKEIAWFPGKNDSDPNVPIQTKYKYSRTESRIPITLYKGCWYHIHARWEKDKILLTDFKVHYKDGDNIKEEQGKLYKNLFGSPGRVWAINEKNTETGSYPPDPHKEGNKTYFYCNNCVISFSHYLTQKKAWRYWSNNGTSSIYTGNFNEGNSDTGDQEEDNKFNLPKMWKAQKHHKDFYYGTVAWTHFYPKDEEGNPIKDKETIFKINGKTFSNYGQDSNPPANKPNSIFMQQYSNKGNDPNASFRFELHDKGDDISASHLETTIVDRVVLYMIVQPQPLHWSHNIYKDQK